VTELLLDIHGQHEHQSLLKPGIQLKVLDDFAGEACVRAKKETEEAYEAYVRALRERGQFTLSEEERRRQMDFLDYEIEEITRAGVLPGEREELSARFKEMNAFGKIRAALENSLAFLSEGRENASELLLRAGRELGEAARLAEPLSDINQQLMTAQDIISSAEQDIRSYLETAEFDEGAFFRVEKRLDELNRLELKYGDLSRPENRALEERRQAREELAAYERRLELAQREVEESRERLEAAAEILHQHRMKALPLWDKALSGALKELNFLTVDYQTLWEEAPEIGSEGKDRISFTISLNPGEERRPLQKVASGGELSRIMLAIKTILADRDEIPTVIFDEIDSGISGQTA
ncbi:MAG: DNA repair protein RecN, partial [Lachnospiraceae bacterium]|nr:DNA repair protein RecN [Lachnospiraceae bacterium]